MSFDWKKWLEFGTKVSVLWYVVLALLTYFNLVNVGAIFGGLGASIMGVLIFTLVNGVLWVAVGYIYEEMLESAFGKTPFWITAGVLVSVATFLVAALLGVNVQAAAISALYVPIIAGAFIFAYATPYVFEQVDWDVAL